jgi:hypothetical protein
MHHITRYNNIIFTRSILQIYLVRLNVTRSFDLIKLLAQLRSILIKKASHIQKALIRVCNAVMRLPSNIIYSASVFSMIGDLIMIKFPFSDEPSKAKQCRSRDCLIVTGGFYFFLSCVLISFLRFVKNC